MNCSGYTFKHALVQDTAYRSLLESQRKELHGRIADAIEVHFPEHVAREPETIARHCEEAGRTAEAIGHYQRAGEGAAQRFAHAEAIGHLRKGVDLLRTLPESAERNQQELTLRIALGAPLQATRGMNSPEGEETYERALLLSRTLGDSPERFRALAGLAIVYRNREVKRALELGEELLAYAERTGESSELLVALSNLGVPLLFSGQLSKALAYEERAIVVYDPTEHRSLASVYGLDPGIVALCFASFALLQLGHPDRALERVEEAIEQARAHTHPHSLAYVLLWGSVVDHARGEPRRVLVRAEEAIEISTERGFPQHLGGGMVMRAWALSILADVEDAGRVVDEMIHPAEILRVVQGKPTYAPVQGPFTGASVDALRRLNRLDDALGVAEGWVEYSSEIAAPYWDAELLRLKGEILLEQNPAAGEEAESLFLRAIATAESQEAKFHELRAATSLARLWQRQSKLVLARDLLAPVHDWFTEGFDTADLKDAKALLEELA